MVTVWRVEEWGGGVNMWVGVYVFVCTASLMHMMLGKYTLFPHIRWIQKYESHYTVYGLRVIVVRVRVGLVLYCQ